MTDGVTEWFDDFLGLGYHLYDVRPVIFLLLDERRKLAGTWNKVLKYLPDDEIKMRFVETDEKYGFVLYCQSRILQSTWVFFKSLNTSVHYRQFKDDYDGAAILKLALLIKKKDGSTELEIFKHQKRITDVKFMTEPEAVNDAILASSLRKMSSQSGQ
ncbi:MAG: hypothetical protein KGI33_10360 [Thaumarchaeota archaeon]|nr:hypothetical protein [Nitrososphaerota archaeon]